MARTSKPYPTELELAILKILWQDGPQPVRQVREALANERALAHTTVMTMLNIMTKKGYLTRTRAGNSYVYRPRIRWESTASRMLRDVVDRVFDGSAAAAVAQLLDTADLDDAELARLRALIERKKEETE